MSYFQFSEDRALHDQGSQTLQESCVECEGVSPKAGCTIVPEICDIKKMSNDQISEGCALRVQNLYGDLVSLDGGEKVVFGKLILADKTLLFSVEEELIKMLPTVPSESAVVYDSSDEESDSELPTVFEKDPSLDPRRKKISSTLRADAPEWTPSQQVMELSMNDFLSSDVEVIPPYSNQSLTEIFDIYAGLLPDDRIRMAQFGYPPYLLDRVRKSFDNKTPIDPFGRRVVNLEERAKRLSSRGVAGFGRQRYDVGEVAKTWVIPKTRATLVVKPQIYNNRTFKNWVLGVASKLWDSCTKKTQIVTGNEACRVLYFSDGSQLTSRSKQDLLSKASVYIQDFSSENKEPAPLTLGASMSHMNFVRSFRFGTFEVKSLDDVVLIENYFRRNKPLYRALVAYYNGEPVNPEQLQSSLLKSFPVINPEGKIGDGVKWVRETLKCPSRVRVSVDPVEINHTFTLNISSLLTSDQKDFAQMLIQVTGMIACIFDAKSWKGVVGAVSSFAVSRHAVWEFAKERINALMGSVMVLNGVFDSFIASVSSNLSSFWETVVGCSVVAVLSTMKDSFFKLLSPLVGDLVKECRVAMLRTTATDMAKSLTAWVVSVINRVKSAIELRSLSPLWGDKWDPKVWIFHANNLVTYFTLLTVQSSTNPDAMDKIVAMSNAGELPSEWIMPVSIDEYIERVDRHLMDAPRMLEYFCDRKDLVAEIRKAEIGLIQHLDRIKLSEATHGQRVQPFMVVFYGPPGVGKTNLLNQSLGVIENLVHIPMSGNRVYAWQNAVNFQDGLNHATTAIVMDDADHSIAPPSPGFPTHIESLIQIVNNKPLPVEQANVNMKGTVFASPALVAVSTNFLGIRAKEFSLRPHACWRRIGLHVTVAVKPEFALPDGRMDVRKAEAAETHDIFDLQVARYKPHPTDANIFLDAPVTMGVSEFNQLLVKSFKEHHQSQLSLLRRNSVSGQFCESCGLKTDKRCSCIRREGAAPTLSFIGELPDHLLDGSISDEVIPGGYWGLYERMAEYVMLGADVSTDVRFVMLLNTCKQSIRLKEVLVGEFPYFKKSDIHRRLINRTFYFREWLYEIKDLAAEDCLPFKYDERFCSPRFSYLEWENSWRARIIGTSSTSLTPSKWYGQQLAGLACFVGLLAFAGTFLKSQVVESLEGRENNVVDSSALPMSWQRADQMFKPGIVSDSVSFGTVTYTFEQLKDDVLRASLKVFQKVDGKYCFHMYCLVVGHNTIVVPTHVCKDDTSIYLLVKNEVYLEVRVDKFTRRVFGSNPEACIVKVPGLPAFPNLFKKIWVNEDAMVQSFDELKIVGCDGEVYRPSRSGVKKRAGVHLVWSDAQTKEGDCGLAYLGCVNNSWKIVGMHYGSEETSTLMTSYRQSVGFIVTQREIQLLASSLTTTMQGIKHVTPTMSQYPANLAYGKFGMKSEILAAKEFHGAVYFPIGNMTPELPGSTNKSKIVKSLLADDPEILSFCREVCGRDNYWTIPNFRGEMIDGKWCSAWTNMFTSQNLKNPESRYMLLALADYLNGIQHLLASGYRALSENEAIIGVPGAGVNSVNMKTSVGPPLKGGKRSHLAVEDGRALMSPEFCVVKDAIESVLLSGDIPSVLAVGSLKDEPLKYTKRFSRVFQNMPASMNLILKEIMTPLKLLMRSNWQFFECMVGINMTSSDCNNVVQYLKMVSPSLDSLYDCDATMFDKSWSGVIYDYVAMVFYAMALTVGVDAQRVFSLVHALKHVTYSIKNDLFEVCHNPSGNDITVELNSVAISLGERYVWYRTHPIDVSDELLLEYQSSFFSNPVPSDELASKLSFRDNIALLTYGDDNLKATKEALPDEYCNIWLDELGIEMLDASKTKSVSRKTLSEVSFLKRNFVDLEGVEGKVAVLDQKSMARMILLKRDSTLGLVDHAAVVSSEFLREAVYYGEAYYNEKANMFKRIAAEKGFSSNPYFVVKSYSERLKEVQDGTFQTWSNREPIPREDSELAGLPVASKILFEAMSNVNLVKASDSGAPPPVQSSTVTHVLGEMSAENVVSDVVPRDFDPKYFQTFSDAGQLGNFLGRATYVHSTPLASIDVPDTTIDDFYPFELFMADPVIAEKLSHYRYLNGTMQVIGVVTSTPMAYGCYCVSAIPYYMEGASVINQELVPQNCFQVDHYAKVDVATSNSFVLQLPWVGRSDMLETYSPELAQMWKVSVVCLSRVQGSTASSTSKGIIQFYVNLLDPELCVPRLEGKLKLKANHALKTLAPEIHAQIGEGRGSKIAGTIASAAESLSTIPVIGSVASTVGAVARGAETVLSWFGFTVQQNEKQPIVVLNRSTTSTAHADGEDSGFVASLSATNDVDIDPGLAGSGQEDCLAFSYLFQKWTLVSRSIWSQTDNRGDYLAQVAVTPFLCNQNTDLSYRFMPAGFVGLPFSFWRGDMEYMIVIPCSKAHRGTVQVFWAPAFTAVSHDVTNIAPNAIIDVAAQEDRIFSVGYSRETPTLRCSPCFYGMSIFPEGATNGTLAIRVVNPLMAPLAAASVDILIFARASTNMSFGVPRDSFLFVGPDGTTPSFVEMKSQIKLEGAIGDDNVASSPETTELVPASGPYPIDQILFGECVSSVRELLQKPSQLQTVSVTTQAIMPCPVNSPRNPNGEDSSSWVNWWTWQGHYSAMYYGMAFSERYKLLPQVASWGGASRWFKYTSAETNSSIPTMTPLSYTEPQRGTETRVPYYGDRKFRFLRTGDSATDNGPKTVVTCFNGSHTSSPLMLYYSFGPDIRASMFVQVPLVRIVATPTTFRPYW